MNKMHLGYEDDKFSSVDWFGSIDFRSKFLQKKIENNQIVR
jgi:hypothetical protein